MTWKLNKREMLYLFLTYTQPPGPLTCSLTLDPIRIRFKDLLVRINKKEGIRCMKSLHALDKTQSKRTALLLLFFISMSQWGLQHGANAHISLQVQYDKLIFFLLLFFVFFFVLASEFSFLLLSSSKLRITCRLEIQDSRQCRT